MRLKDKTALVTGAAGGIGLAIAKRYSQEGANVVLNGFGAREDIDRAIAEVEAQGEGRVVYHGADMMKPAEIADLIATAAKEFGDLDVLVNNAGIQHC